MASLVTGEDEVQHDSNNHEDSEYGHRPDSFGSSMTGVVERYDDALAIRLLIVLVEPSAEIVPHDANVPSFVRRFRSIFT
jgi:hypothetical protein